MRLIWKKLSNAPYRKKKLIDEQQLSFEGSLRIHIVVWHRTAEDSCMKRMPKLELGKLETHTSQNLSVEDSCMKRMPKFACQETCNDFTAQKMNWNGHN